MSFLRRLWDEAGNVSEDEPTMGGFLLAGAVFVMWLLVVFVYTIALAPR